MTFLYRLAGAPNKCDFLQNGMNVIDVLAILPYYVEMAMAMQPQNIIKQEVVRQPVFMAFNYTIMDEGTFDEEEDNLQGVLQVFRVFKLARILKLAR